MKRSWLILYTIFIFFSAAISILLIMIWQSKDMEMAGKCKFIFLFLLLASVSLTAYTLILEFMRMIEAYKNNKKIKWFIGILYSFCLIVLFCIAFFYLVFITRMSLRDNITTNYQVFYRILCCFCIAQLIHNEYYKLNNNAC